LSFPTCCVCLEPRPLPSTEITRLRRYYGPLRHPKAPGLSLAGVRLIILAPRQGVSRVARAFLVCMLSPLPRRSDWRRTSLISSVVSAFPERVIGSACASSFSRIAQCSHYITACTLAGSPLVIRYIEGFSHFVTSMTAPITSGWSDIAGWDLHPLEKRRLFTAHTRSRHSKIVTQFYCTAPLK
jgi:hypothetical protein